jgi:hypothetical protein
MTKRVAAHGHTKPTMYVRGGKSQLYQRSGLVIPLVKKTASSQQETITYADEELRPFLVYPYKQTLIDLQYLVQELQSQDFQHEAIVLIDVNQDADQKYRDQVHTAQYVTSNHFNVDGSIGGSLHTFMSNCGPRVSWWGGA